MDFERVLEARHSERAFRDQVIPTTTLKKIVNQAQLTPSWANAQPWQVVIATGKTLNEIQSVFQRRTEQGVAGSSDLEIAHRTNWAEAPRRNMATWSNDLGRYLAEKNVGASAYGTSQLSLFNSPALVYLIVPAPVNSWETFDTGAFAQTLMLSAANQGVQSMPAYEIVKYPDELRRILKLNSGQKILMGIALGYADESVINGFRTSRVATDDILTIQD
ncbi:nitroreductase [Lactiplantibacillus sp. WILCCON 0030]|uniref:Nitroreductase n=2 Tax=Lactiplantibacillus brownii TaxID=3069269 RepID=A0ABU1AAM1_9LACO|nr:nitroreductase [Lactiplantibacillus brownii]MDQ7937443.1 nitroreductase [Lactiplantibacillus brownii]